MTRAGRRVQVQSVLTGMLIYLAMAFDFPPWAIKAVDKFGTVFFEEDVKMQKVAIVLWPGSKFTTHQSMEVWEFQISSLLAGPCA
jgi:hypothetical protein